jgi:hypothetical protein
MTEDTEIERAIAVLAERREYGLPIPARNAAEAVAMAKREVQHEQDR